MEHIGRVVHDTGALITVVNDDLNEARQQYMINTKVKFIKIEENLFDHFCPECGHGFKEE